MTDLQLLYNLNAKRSRELCRELEDLLEKADVYEKLLQYEIAQVARFRIDDIRNELNSIWDQQVDLFQQIIDEYKAAKQTKTEHFRNMRKKQIDAYSTQRRWSGFNRIKKDY